MATQIGSGTGVLATYLANLGDVSNIETALKQLYYGTTGGTLSQTTGIYGALYTLFTGNPTLAGNVTITGTLTVNGATTTINSTTLNVDDKLIELGAVTTPTNTTADGGGISLLGATNKTIIWDNANANWTTSENWNLATGKALRIGAGGSTTNVISGSATALVVGENATTLTVGNTASASTTNIATGANGTGVTKALNIGTGAGTGGTTSIVIGSSPAVSTSDITLSGAVYGYQPSPTSSLTTSQTLTIAQLETLIITTAQSIGITLSLPTGTNIESGLPASSQNGTSFDFSIINAGTSGAITVGANGNTIIGSTSVALGTSGRFRVLKNATNSYTIYRIS